jgi:hypothetical protein
VVAAGEVRCEVPATSKLQRSVGERVKAVDDASHIATPLWLGEFVGDDARKAQEAARELVTCVGGDPPRPLHALRLMQLLLV